MSKDLKVKSLKELNKALADAREDLRKFRFNISGSGKKNVRASRLLRKQIAQILTEINSRS
ncbi:MAG TPA: 50S ribosomal protein L29 [Candidatus Paceibacterota bacterium]|nr:50S ribosomal protein L29 [Candidatus Paceibacterota bacterium]HRZ34296.1 50S ribosomal protein L29 [Candidatus Paceibacterota bacterium]